jgi:hypothetical protein
MKKKTTEQLVLEAMISGVNRFLTMPTERAGIPELVEAVGQLVFNTAEMELSGLHVIFLRYKEEVYELLAICKSNAPHNDDPILIHRIECLSNDMITLSAIHLVEMD